MSELSLAILRALAMLDHDDVTHWTTDGLPVVTVVKDLAATEEAITRGDINDVAPTFKRGKPEELPDFEENGDELDELEDVDGLEEDGDEVDGDVDENPNPSPSVSLKPLDEIDDASKSESEEIDVNGYSKEEILLLDDVSFIDTLAHKFSSAINVVNAEVLELQNKIRRLTELREVALGQISKLEKPLSASQLLAEVNKIDIQRKVDRAEQVKALREAGIDEKVLNKVFKGKKRALSPQGQIAQREARVKNAMNHLKANNPQL